MFCLLLLLLEMKTLTFIVVLSLSIVFLPVLAQAQTSTLDAGGMIDEGGIMTNREQEQVMVQKLFDDQKQEDQGNKYWLRVAGIIIGALLVFEVGVRAGGKKSPST